MPPTHTWKNVERRLAALFGTKRVSLSGGNSKISRSDTMHDALFIEVKHRTACIVGSWYEFAAQCAAEERKVPLVVLHIKKSTRFLVVCDVEHLPVITRQYLLARGVLRTVAPARGKLLPPRRPTRKGTSGRVRAS